MTRTKAGIGLSRAPVSVRRAHDRSHPGLGSSHDLVFAASAPGSPRDFNGEPIGPWTASESVQRALLDQRSRF